jgi:hypothetical protein
VIRLVDPKDVPLSRKQYERDVLAQMERLKKEGQIEPILLREDGYADLDSWAYAEAQIEAAVRLGWNTILVTP